MTVDPSVERTDYVVHAIGYVRRKGDEVHLEILEPYRPALTQLEHFSHVIVLWWAHKEDTEESRSKMQCHPPYAPSKLTGVFACRAEYRPNPIAVTTCKISEVDEAKGIVDIYDIDALDGTPVLDLKGYFPVCDRVKEPRIPDWLEGWPEWMPDEGLGLEY